LIGRKRVIEDKRLTGGMRSKTMQVEERKGEDGLKEREGGEGIRSHHLGERLGSQRAIIRFWGGHSGEVGENLGETQRQRGRKTPKSTPQKKSKKGEELTKLGKEKINGPLGD